MPKKIGSLEWRDSYRIFAVLALWPLISWNYRQRREGDLPDEWYWADTVIYSWGWAIV